MTYGGGSCASPVVSVRNVAFVHVRSDFVEAPTDPANQYDVAIVDTNTGNTAAQAFDVPIKDYWGTTYAGPRGLSAKPPRPSWCSYTLDADLMLTRTVLP